MKSQFARIVLTAGLAALFGSLTLSAQNQQETVKIPFAFQANHNIFAPGDYSISQLTQNGVFRIGAESQGHSIFVSALPAIQVREPKAPHLTFVCYGGDCVLSQIWLPDATVGYIRTDSSIDQDHRRKLGMSAMISVPFRAH